MHPAQIQVRLEAMAITTRIRYRFAVLICQRPLLKFERLLQQFAGAARRLSQTLDFSVHPARFRQRETGAAAVW
jgi:hypothetical protein